MHAKVHVAAGMPAKVLFLYELPYFLDGADLRFDVLVQHCRPKACCTVQHVSASPRSSLAIQHKALLAVCE